MSPAAAHDAGPAALEITTANLNLVLTGRIEQRCAMSGGGDFDLGQLTAGRAAGGVFSLVCNVPFDLRLTSANGGLAHEEKPTGEGPFAGLLAYDVRVRVPVLEPDPQVLQGTFGSPDLSGGAVLSSGDAVSGPGEGRLEIVTRPIPQPGLLAGRYSETLTLSVTPRI